ncbi:MAG: sugar phosphate isomerase/epimerase [Acidimicrobiia bacterium]|nr:sugar phosphate isomerase/epimerase [Acidimicrobiia bacterium]
MTIRIANSPCSWGVEFADDPRNLPWRQMLAECAAAGYKGIELGPVGYMPEDPAELGEALAEHDLELVGGVVYRPFHDPARWDEVLDAATRTAQVLAAHRARHLVIIDSIAERRAPTAGRPDEAEQMGADEWGAYRDRIAHTARMSTDDFGLTTSVHPHAGGFVDFQPEVERLLSEIDDSILGLCLDTGHFVYAGGDPVEFMGTHRDRLRYVHFKDIDPAVKADVIANRTGFYQACGRGIFCHLGRGEVDFAAVKRLLTDIGYDDWCTVEQDCDPEGDTSPLDDAIVNREFLVSMGFD